MAVYGCIITKGIQDWSILQHKDGFAELELGGIYKTNDDVAVPKIFVRVVTEANGENVVPWKRCHVDGADWNVVLSIPCGGLYRIETCIQNNDEYTPDFWSTRGDMIHHVGVGDVFVIAGQSNSVGYGKGEYTDEPELGIHVLKKNGKWDLATHPLGECTGTDGVDIEIDRASVGHSPWMSYAKYMKRKLGYPIGLIQTALGGSALKSWNPDEDGNLYRQMMNVIRKNNDNIKGVLWSQGCSDTENEETAGTYGKRLKNMIDCMRKELGSQICFLVLQTNRQLDRMEFGGNIHLYNIVQQQQRMIAKTTERVCIAPTNDQNVSDWIHNDPRGNVDIGIRAAKTTLKHIYNIDIKCPDAPDLSCASTADGKTIAAEFGNVYGNLFVHHQRPEKLALGVEDEDGEVPLASVSIVFPNKIQIECAREIGNGAVIFGGSNVLGEKEIPTDTQSRMPMLAFREHITKK